MRRAKRPLPQQSLTRRQHAGDAVDLGGFDGLGKTQGRQYAGQAFRQHGLARSRRPDHEDVVGARCRYLQRALGRNLPSDVAKIRSRNFRRELRRAQAGPLARIPQAARSEPRPRPGCLTPKTRTPSTTAASAAFSAGRMRVRDTLGARAHRHGERPAHRPYRAIERKLADQQMMIQPRDRPHGAQNSKRHGQIESRAFFAHVGRSKIDRDRFIGDTRIRS